jgi:hypothetical protein
VGRWSRALLAGVLAVVGCGQDIQPIGTDPATAPPSTATPSPSSAASPSGRASATDLSAIACATDDPEGVGELTGVWAGSEGGVYYIRHVGDCVWWFGTELDAIEPGRTGQPGFANVASGRVTGTHVEVEWVDLPIGNILGGGGLTFAYVAEDGQLVLTEQRGDWEPFGAKTLTRVVPNAGPDASSGGSASP